MLFAACACIWSRRRRLCDIDDDCLAAEPERQMEIFASSSPNRRLSAASSSTSGNALRRVSLVPSIREAPPRDELDNYNPMVSTPPPPYPMPPTYSGEARQDPLEMARTMRRDSDVLMHI